MQKHQPGSNGNTVITADFGKEGAAFCRNSIETWTISIATFRSGSWIEPGVDYVIEKAHFMPRTTDPHKPASQSSQLTEQEWQEVLDDLKLAGSRLFTVSETQTSRCKRRMIEAIKRREELVAPWTSAWVDEKGKISAINDKGVWKTDDTLSAQRLYYYLATSASPVATLRSATITNKSYSPGEEWGQEVRREQNTMLINAGHSTIEQLGGMRMWKDPVLQEALSAFLRERLTEEEHRQLYFKVKHEVEKRKTVLRPLGLTEATNKALQEPVMRHDWEEQDNPQILRSVWTCVVDIDGNVRTKFGHQADQVITPGLVVDKLLKMHGDRAGANAGSTARAYVYNYGFPNFLRNRLWGYGIVSDVNCQNIASRLADGDITTAQKSEALQAMKQLVKKLVPLLVEFVSTW